MTFEIVIVRVKYFYWYDNIWLNDNIKIYILIVYQNYVINKYVKLIINFS